MLDNIWGRAQTDPCWCLC